MADLELENDEQIICRVREARISDGKTNYALEGLFLTNKYLISVYEKPFALFSKEKMIIDKKPLGLISSCNGEIEVATVKDDEFEIALHVFYDNGMDYLYSLGEDVPKSMYLQWKDAIKKAVIENRKNIPIKEENNNENTESTHSTTITKETNEKNEPIKDLNVIFCTNCGAKNNFEAKFCQSCGIPIQVINNPQSVEKMPNMLQKIKRTSDMTQNSETTYSDRKQEFVGKILKCPVCGEILKSFVTCCPVCGYELREIESAMSIKKFVAKLEQIEGDRTESMEDEEQLCKTDLQKINLIRSFSVPNTKEDLIEFFILAASNVNENYGTLSASQEALSHAWEAKYEQVYQKAIICLGDTPEIKEIKKIYNEKRKNLNKKNKSISRFQKTKGYFLYGFMIAYVMICLVILALWAVK